MESGGLAIPSVLKYYHSAMLVSALDWWQFQLNSDILALEQADSYISLTDCLTETKKSRLQPRGINQIAAKLAHV